MHISTLISVEELQTLLGAPHVRLFDCRFNLADPVAGRSAWQQERLPGALHADMERDLSLPHRPGQSGRHPLPERSAWVDRVGAWGILPTDLVVCYDDAGGAGAARLWWMLLWAGHASVVVLDGGIQAWKAAGGALDTTQPGPAAWPASCFAAGESLTRLVDASALVETVALDPAPQLLLDARDRARFAGEVEPIDPVAGHIPRTQCSPWTENLQADGRFKNPQALREKFASALHSELPVVCYCGSGVTACHNILAMVHAGFPMPALYAGSWSEWITDPARAVATGAGS